jgi:hypothetical protein
MSKYKFSVYQTGKPFSPAERIDETDYSVVSNHTSLSAAHKKQSKLFSEMQRCCGQNAWNNHFAVMPINDIKMVTTSTCPHCSTMVKFKWVWMTNRLNPDFIPPCACEYTDNVYHYNKPDKNILEPIVKKWADKNNVEIVSIS